MANGSLNFYMDKSQVGWKEKLVNQRILSDLHTMNVPTGCVFSNKEIQL
jgi:hypothetical protein